MKEACECCGCLTVKERGSYGICPVCFWEDDGPWANPDDEIMRGGPNGGLTLTEARTNYRSIGACDPRMLNAVRPPTKEESQALTDPQESER